MAAKRTFIQYGVTHTTLYKYGGRIDLCHSETRLSPPTTRFQKKKSHRLKIEPNPDAMSERIDHFGNQSVYFSVQHSHKKLRVTAESCVQVSTETRPWEKPFEDPPWEKCIDKNRYAGKAAFELGDFILPSHAAPRHKDLEAFARECFTPGGSLFACARRLMARIYDNFVYVPGVTEIHTPVLEVLEYRRGVCQDFAHLMIGCLRSLGLAARYVSGYLETLPPPGAEKLQGADASHAWVELHIPKIGWVPFDPTNNLCPSAHHIVLATGRDYFDVQPVRGIFVGAGAQMLSVEVDVVRKA